MQSTWELKHDVEISDYDITRDHLRIFIEIELLPRFEQLKSVRKFSYEEARRVEPECLMNYIVFILQESQNLFILLRIWKRLRAFNYHVPVLLLLVELYKLLEFMIAWRCELITLILSHSHNVQVALGPRSGGGGVVELNSFNRPTCFQIYEHFQVRSHFITLLRSVKFCQQNPSITRAKQHLLYSVRIMHLP